MRKLVAGAIVSAVLAVAPAAITAPAQAGVDIDIFIAPGPGIYIEPGPGYLSCRQVARRLFNRGYRNIGVIDCRGRSYVYRASRHHRWWQIKASSLNGRIIDVWRIR